MEPFGSMGCIIIRLLYHPDAAVKMFAPIAAGEVGVGDGAAGIGGVDELAVAGIDAGVGDTAAVCIRKEHNVAGLQVGLVHLNSGAVLGVRGAAYGNAEGAVHIVHKAGAVEAAGRGAAIDIGCAQILRRLGENLCPGDGGADGSNLILSGDVGSRAAGYRTAGRCPAGRCPAGQCSDDFALTEVLRGVGGRAVLVGNFAQAQVVAADVACLLYTSDAADE